SPLSKATAPSMNWLDTSASTPPSSTPGRSSSWPAPRVSSPTAPSPTLPTPRHARPSCSSTSADSKWSWNGSKKKLPPSAEDKRPLVEVDHPILSVRRQCQLLGLNRASLYYQPAAADPEDLR